MDIKELKNLIKKSTAVLVLDDGDPAMVILDYKLYKELVSEKEEKDIKINPVRSLARAESASPEDLGEATSNGINHSSAGDTVNGGGFHNIGNGVRHKESELLEKLNREILALKNQIEVEERSFANSADHTPID